MLHPSTGSIDIAVIQLPRIANFDDCHPLESEPGVQLRYVSDVRRLGTPDAVIIPGTKSTIADYEWMQQNGLAEAIVKLAENGHTHIVGICGGYQMLGKRIDNPHNIESDLSTINTLALLDMTTVFEREKSTYQVQATVQAGDTWLSALTGETIAGYEIHMGQSRHTNTWLTITERNHAAVVVPDGGISANGHVWGCYIHGLFHNHNLRRAWLRTLGYEPTQPTTTLDDALNRLADHVELSINMDDLLSLVDLPV